MIEYKNLTYLRALCAINIVALHCFSIFGSSWEVPDGVYPIALYDWFGRLLGYIPVPMFFLISGYLYQSKNGYPQLSWSQFVIKKANRLLLPSVIFSIIYVLLFYDDSLVVSILKVFSGAGHLWFLPALFLCFLFAKAVKINSQKWLLPILFVSMVAAFIPLSFSFGIKGCLRYFSFFFIGMLFSSNQDIIPRLYRFRFVFLAIFLLVYFSSPWASALSSSKLVQQYLIGKNMQLLGMLSGVMCIFLIFSKIQDLPRRIIKVANLSMGIYIFQEFVIKVVYYRTDMPKTIDSLLLPFVTFIIAFCASYYLSYSLRKIPIFKYLF